MGTASFPWVKRPGRGNDHPSPSSAEVKERVELYLYSPSRPSRLVLGKLYFYLYVLWYRRHDASIIQLNHADDVNKNVSVAVMLTVMFHSLLCHSITECVVTSTNSNPTSLQPQSYATVHLLAVLWATSWCREPADWQHLAEQFAELSKNLQRNREPGICKKLIIFWDVTPCILAHLNLLLTSSVQKY